MSRRHSKLPNNSTATLRPQNPWTMDDRRSKIYDLNGSLESVALVWRLLGVFPITPNGPLGERKYGLSTFYALYGFLIFAICFVNYVYCMLLQYDQLFRSQVPMVMATVYVREFASLVCMMITNFFRTIRFKRVVAALEKMSEQALILEKMGCRLDYESSAKSIRRYVWTTLGIVLGFVIYDFVLSSPTLEVRSIHMVLWTFPLVAQILDLTVFASLVGCLGFEFRALNEKMRIVVTRANASSANVIAMSDVHAENLRTLSKAHYNVCAVGKRINGLFDWDMAVNVTTAFFILSTTLYYIFYEVQREGETRGALIFKYVQWEFIHGAPIIIIVIVCNWTSRQARYAGKLIHRVRVDNEDSQLYEVVKSFSLQLHHQKLRFTAGGFFPLNSTLLQTMLGNITTYLVILIQFQPDLDRLSA